MKSFVEEALDENCKVEMLSDSAAKLLPQVRSGMGKLKHLHMRFLSVQGLLREAPRNQDWHLREQRGHAYQAF